MGQRPRRGNIIKPARFSLGLVIYLQRQRKGKAMAHRITVAELEYNEGQKVRDILEDVIFGTRHCPAMCSDGCEVEIDGHCEHGFESLALHMGVV